MRSRSGCTLPYVMVKKKVGKYLESLALGLGFYGECSGDILGSISWKGVSEALPENNFSA